jgi:hypothetical protein
MAHRTPTPHQLNAARGCVGRSEVQALWRARGATPAAMNMKDVASGPQARTRRSRPAAVASAPPLSEIQEPEIGDVAEIPDQSGDEFEMPAIAEIQDSEIHEPEIADIADIAEFQDPNGHEPEIPDEGHPEPDVPEPDIPEPDIPEPEPEHPRPASH